MALFKGATALLRLIELNIYINEKISLITCSTECRNRDDCVRDKLLSISCGANGVRVELQAVPDADHQFGTTLFGLTPTRVLISAFFLLFF
jgi:hypothetical protein